MTSGETPAPLRWGSRLHRSAGGLTGDLVLYALATGFAAVTAATSTLPPHRAWGAVATWGYAVAMLLAAVQLTTAQLAARRTPRRRGDPVRGWAGPAGRSAVTASAWLSTALLPLAAQAVQRSAGRTDRAQEEVFVVEQGGIRLLDTGTPYLGRDAIAALPPAEQLLGYLPYQPGMAVFGLPRAVAGDVWWTDARVWFAAATAVALAAAVGVLRGRVPAGALVRAAQFATVLPVCALTLATGGDDLPVLALCLLALALCAVRRFGAAGVAVGAAAALKLFAWPVAVVLLAHAAATGRRPLLRYLAPAVALPVLALVGPALVDARALVENVLRFPLGDGLVASPARSPLPGYLIANALPGGRLLAAGLLAAAAVAIGIHLLRRPPAGAADAALVSGYGLLAAMLLMPSTRFGYLMYPLALLAWAPALRTGAQAGRTAPPGEPATGTAVTAATGHTAATTAGSASSAGLPGGGAPATGPGPAQESGPAQRTGPAQESGPVRETGPVRESGPAR